MNLATLVSAPLVSATPTQISYDQGPWLSFSWIVSVILYVLLAIALWRIFTKAGLPGILGIIPIVNLFFLVKIAGMSMWLTLLFVIPVVNIVFAIILALKLGTAFGKGGAFSFFLLFLFHTIGYLILGFGSATYTKPVRA